MMPTLIENIACELRPYRSREEAARVLDGLRATYQALSREQRNQFKAHLEKLARVQSATERE